MPRQVILASHGELATGLLNTLKLILGETVNARAWGLTPGHNAAELVDMLAPEIESHPQVTYIILTDLYGASVFTSLCQLLSYKNVHLFSGLNTALAIAALTEEGGSMGTAETQGWIDVARNDIRETRAADLEQSPNQRWNEF